MTPVPVLRRARNGDAEWLARSSQRLIENDLPWSWTPPRVRHLLHHCDTNAYVLEVEQQPAGFSIATFGRRRAHLVLLAVLDEHRRMGFATELLEWQLLAAQTAGICRMSLEVRARNRGARLFYQHMGFRFVQTIPRYYSRREDAVRMTLAPLRLPNSQHYRAQGG